MRRQTSFLPYPSDYYLRPYTLWMEITTDPLARSDLFNILYYLPLLHRQKIMPSLDKFCYIFHEGSQAHECLVHRCYGQSYCILECKLYFTTLQQNIEVAAEGTSGENIFSLTDKGPYSKNVPPQINSLIMLGFMIIWVSIGCQKVGYQTNSE